MLQRAVNPIRHSALWISAFPWTDASRRVPAAGAPGVDPARWRSNRPDLWNRYPPKQSHTPSRSRCPHRGRSPSPPLDRSRVQSSWLPSPVSPSASHLEFTSAGYTVNTSHIVNISRCRTCRGLSRSRGHARFLGVMPSAMSPPRRPWPDWVRPRQVWAPLKRVPSVPC